MTGVMKKLNNTIMSRLKQCETEEELKDLCTVIKMQLQTLHDDYYNKRIGFWKFREEQERLEQCRHYANYICDIWNIERMV